MFPLIAGKPTEMLPLTTDKQVETGDVLPRVHGGGAHEVAALVAHVEEGHISYLPGHHRVFSLTGSKSDSYNCISVLKLSEEIGNVRIFISAGLTLPDQHIRRVTCSYLDVRYVGKVDIALCSAAGNSHPLFDVLRRINRICQL